MLTFLALALAFPMYLKIFTGTDFTAEAMPAWSRKYNADCSLCHTTYPRLNRTGYEFMMRGYRFDWESDMKDMTSTGDAKTASYTPSPSTASSGAGEVLYKKLDCARCHVIKGVGGAIRPALDGIGARRTAQFMIDHLTDPKKHAKNLPLEYPHGARMPATAATPGEIAQLAAYMLTLPSLPSDQMQARRKPRVTDYLAVSYAPSVDIERSNGETNRTYTTRELAIYAAGPVGKYFSFFVQPQPLSQEKGVLGKFEMAQGLLNFGGMRHSLQVRFGQLFNLHNSGFGSTERGVTETQPLIFQPINGFNSGGLGRGVSVEYTAGMTSTFKAFAVSNDKVELDPEFDPLEFRRSQVYGFVYDQVIGKKGLSGVSFQFSGGRTPVLLDGEKQDPVRFQRYSFFANKSFLDKRNFERLNAMFGVSFMRDSRFIGITPDGERKSHGNGFFFEIDAVLLPKHLTVFGRYDKLRQTNLLSDNAVHGAATGVVFDPYRYARFSFEYQRLYGTERSDRFTIRLQFNY